MSDEITPADSVPCDPAPAGPPAPDAPAGRIPVGVSACLLGQRVRHDGGHRQDRFVIDVLGPHFRYMAVCPEVGVGMGVPRPALRLVQVDGQGAGRRLVESRSGRDWTEPMRAWAAARVEALAGAGLRGFVLKARSPSCGMARVKVYGPGGARPDGVGLFAEALSARLPLLPIEEEGRLNDARLRENFVLRVFVYDEWLRLRAAPRPRDLVAFHTRHKILLMSQDPARHRVLGRLVARAGGAPELEALLDEYGAGLMAALARPSSPRRQVNAMQHLAGVVKHRLEPVEKRELGGLIDEYRDGRVPVEVPLTLLRHHLRRSGHAWALEQSYLDPYPRSLGLRSRV